MSAPIPEQTAQLLEAGISAYEKGDFNTALSYLLKITDRDPRNWRAKLYAGMSYIFSGSVAIGLNQLRFVAVHCDVPELRDKAEKALASVTPGNLGKPLAMDLRPTVKTSAPYTIQPNQAAAVSSPNHVPKNPAPAAAAKDPVKRIGSLVNTSTGQRISLIENRTTIGRDKSNAIPLSNDNFVSQCQVAIIRQTSDFFVEDVAAINPTRLNGKILVEKTQLKVGDELKIGKTTFRVE
jgi:hypothetical protein